MTRTNFITAFFNTNRYVDSKPEWAKQLEGFVARGRHVITFTARSPVSSQSSSCQFIIHVKDTDPPKVKKCPSSMREFLSPGEDLVRVFWKDPIFEDNIKVTQVMKNLYLLISMFNRPSRLIL